VRLGSHPAHRIWIFLLTVRQFHRLDRLDEALS
jgi:hypothetical protein